jgi:ABC-type polysaccharide/polyol phosphate transport system ATPase subunit
MLKQDKNLKKKSKNVILSVRKVSFCYPIYGKLATYNKNVKERGFWPLKEVSFDIYEGETLGIVGSNGSGKTTLFKILAGIFCPSSGKIKKIRKNLKIQLLSLGVGFERSLSGRENAILNGMLLGKTRSYMLKRIDAIKRFSELKKFFEEPIGFYSSGMISRLGFSIAIEINSDILLIDETLSVGDSSFAKKSQKAIQSMMNSSRTIILISHDKRIIKKNCGRILFLKNGLLK